MFSAGLSGDIADNVRRQLRGADRDIDREGERTGDRLGGAIQRGIGNSRNRRGIGTLARNLAHDFGKNFNLGIGAARMGRGIVSVIAAATPSVAAAGASMATALVSEIVTTISAIGPGLLGLGSAIGAGLATAALNAGLLYAAFKSGAEGLKELKEEATSLLQELGKPVAEGMIGGLRDAVATLRGALPEINDLLKTTGERFGEIAKSAAETLVSTENLSRIKSILETNNTFLSRFKDGFNDLITSFLILLDAAKPFIDYLGEGLAKFGAWAKSILEAKEASGELAESAQRLLDRWKLLWQTIKDFSAGIGNIFDAIRPLGEQLAQSLADTAASFRAWTGDEANQAKILAFFTKAHELSSAIFDTLGKLFAAGGNSFINADFTNLYAVLDSIATKLGPAIAQIFNQIQEAAGPHLVAVIDNLGTAFQKIADNEVIARAAEWVGILLEELSKLVATDVGSWVLGIVAAWALFGGVLSPIVSLLSSLLGALSPLAAGIAAVVGFIILMWQNSQNLRDAIGGLVDTVLPKFVELWDKLSPKIQPLWENIQKLAGAIGDRLAPVFEVLGPIISRFLDLLGTVLDFVITHLTEVIGFFADLFSGDFEGAWEHAKTIMSNFVSFALEIFEKLRLFVGSIFSGLWDIIWQTLQSAWDKVFDILSNVLSNIEGWIRDFGNWIKVKWDELWVWVGQVFQDAWNGIVEFFSGVWDEFTTQLEETGVGLRAWWDNLWAWVGERFQAAWAWITGLASSAWNGLIDLVHFLFDPWIDFFSQLWTEIGNIASSVWTWITGTLSSIWNGIVNTVHFLFDPWIAFFSQLWTEIQNIASTVWNAISSFFSTIWNTISNTFHTVVGAISSFLSGAWESIKSTASSVWNSITGVASSAWNSVTGAIRSAVDSVTGWLAGIWEDIKSTAISIWNSIVGTASSIWNSVKDAIVGPIADAYNLVAGWIENIKGLVTGVLDWLGTKVSEANAALETVVSKQAEATVAGTAIGGGAGMGTSTFMAEGGIVPAVPGGWPVIVGEAGRSERIEPLDANGLSQRDKAMISRIIADMTSHLTGSGETVVKVMLDGRELTGVIQNVVTANNRAVARDASRRRKVYG